VNRVFRDGTGIFMVNLGHQLRIYIIEMRQPVKLGVDSSVYIGGKQ